ncbi:cytochrome P450 [Amycolatopsis alba]|uniref:Cytochrome P450 n=1 Tax=Amycolatopsis alba DSM 44262 TaxID=1125972 RepID=A0A229S9M2_AMYAL|nr:cytochrome P450 [Amycolatopsis alba]OXM55627.1 cytochrome P450 [Amycolatopsis alba DSM 44262]
MTETVNRRPVDEFLEADPMFDDIHPLLDRARADSPVAEVVTTDPATAGEIRQYYVFGYDLVREALSDTTRFSNIAYAPQLRLLAGRSMLELDPPHHHSYRSLVAPLFRKTVVARRYTEQIREILADLFSRFRTRGHAELLAELTLPFPVRVIAAVIGVPMEDFTFFSDRALRMIDSTLRWPEVESAKNELADYFTRLIAARRARPSDDLVGELVAAERDGQVLTDEEILSFLLLLIPAGIETTHRASSTLIFALLTHPDQHARVRADHSLLPAAFDEAIRWEPAVAGGLRIAKANTTLGGVRIGAGSLVYASFLGANRDPAQYADPGVFDVSRTGLPHVTFGHGPHTCIGMHLARVETDALMHRLFEELPGLRLDPEVARPRMHGKIYRMPTALPVLFTPR